MKLRASRKGEAEIVLVGMLVLGLVVCVFLCMWLYPKYNVYCNQQQGLAALAKAEHSRKVLVEQAKAEMEAAELRAKAISIVGKAAQDFPEYRTQEFIGAFAEAMHNGTINQIIYVPTEANIPILEARSK